MVRTYRQDEKVVRWSQWSPSGMTGHGQKKYGELKKIMNELGKGTAEAVKEQEKPVAVYGRVIHDETGRLTEVRLYLDTYITEAELDALKITLPMDRFYVARKEEPET